MTLDNYAQNQFATDSGYYPYSQLASATFSIEEQSAVSPPPIWTSGALLLGLVLVLVVGAMVAFLALRKRGRGPTGPQAPAST
jgi:hypothetical protein